MKGYIIINIYRRRKKSISSKYQKEWQSSLRHKTGPKYHNHKISTVYPDLDRAIIQRYEVLIIG